MRRNAGGECGRRLCVLVLAILLVCTLALELRAEDGEPGAGIPRAIMYEGYLTDDSGQALPDGSYDFRFSLYETVDGGTPIWTEEHLGVEVVGGVVQVRLGEGTTPADLDLPFDAQYYLGIQLGQDPEMVPRLRLMTTPYAFRAKMADEVPDASVTGEKLAALSVTDEHIANVSWGKITDAPDIPAKGDRGGDNGGPVPANVWHTKGNRNTDPPDDYAGTGDEVDFVLATNGIGRLTIAGDGSNITIDADTLVARYMLSRVTSNEGALFLADVDHGLKRVGNDDVHLYTTGGNLLLEGGNVGVGTPSPTATLHVVSTMDGDDESIASYPVLVETPGQGIAIKVVGDSDVDADNNYVSFWDDGGMRGRIEGQDAIDVLSSWQYWYFTTLDVIEVAVAAFELAGAVSDWRACVITACAPGPSDIAFAALAVAAEAGRVAATQALIWDNLGVSYESSSGDYAEWLERLDPEEVINPGDIVGVFGGEVSKTTDGAERVMVASSAPIILGNMPAEGTEHLYVKTAFMGQVPAWVRGPVRKGDYIVPSGLGDGVGVAVPPHLMTARDYARAVGRAWSASSLESKTLVTVAVGLNQGDVADVVSRQQAAVQALRDDLAGRDADIAAVRSELDALTDRVGNLSGLYQELVDLRASMGKSGELAPAGGDASAIGEASAAGASQAMSD